MQDSELFQSQMEAIRTDMSKIRQWEKHNLKDVTKRYHQAKGQVGELEARLNRVIGVSEGIFFFF